MVEGLHGSPVNNAGPGLEIRNGCIFDPGLFYFGGEKMDQSQLVQGIKDRIQGETNLRWVRFIKRVSQHKLAAITGISQARISLLENGYVKPSDDDIVRLAEGLGVKPDDLSFEPIEGA